jgi:hypothetical protein
MKLAGFLVLLALLFFGAYAAGTRLGPVNTSHSPVQYTGRTSGATPNPAGTNVGGTNMSGMNMGGSP